MGPKMRIVSYQRVSTDRQGRSGLGLEAQSKSIEDYARTVGGEVVASFVEVESGADNDRPELAKALAQAKRLKATLVIATLDRLSRNAHFLLYLQAQTVPIVAADMPHADKFMFGIMALWAEKERDMISQRTKLALKAARAKGVRLGSPTAAKTISAAREVRSAKAKARAKNLIAIINDIERNGVTTLAGIAKALEARGVATPRGNVNWFPATVAQVRSTAA